LCSQPRWFAAINEPLGSAAAGDPPPSTHPADTDPIIPFSARLTDFLPEFEDVLNTSKALSPLQTSDIFHYIKTTGPLNSSCFRSFDGENWQGKEGDIFDSVDIFGS
jgi:hypothetical protein